MFKNFLMILLLLAVIILIVAVQSYNVLQRLAQLVKEARSNIYVSLKKRHELANKLIDIAQGYAGHEKLVHLKLSQDAAEAGIAAAYQQANFTLAQVGALAEKLPELKADGTYRQLMADLQTIEADLQKKRERYNATCRDFNTKRNSIPTVFFAPSFGFSEAPFLDFDAGSDLDKIKDFASDDGAMLQRLLSNAGEGTIARTRGLSRQLTAVSGQLLRQGLQLATERAAYRYIDIHNVSGGPAQLEELARLHGEGTLQSDSLICMVGTDTWITYATLVKKVSDASTSSRESSPERQADSVMPEVKINPSSDPNSPAANSNG